jgi:GNAT superfamily N-acetyltransferase
MAYKTAEGGVLSESEKFIIKEASPREREKLYNIFRELMPSRWRFSGSFHWDTLTIVALDKEANNRVIGGMERAIFLDKHFAEGVGFAVLPDFQEHGVGTELLKTIDNKLKRLGVERVITAPTEKSLKIFRENGYEWDPKTKAYLKETGEDERVFIGNAKAYLEKYL